MCSRHTKRQGQSLFGHLSRRANCFRRSRTSAFSRMSSASRSVATRGLPFVVMNLTPIIACPASFVMLIEKVFVLGVIVAQNARNIRSLATVPGPFGTAHPAFQLLALFFEQNPPSTV